MLSWLNNIPALQKTITAPPPQATRQHNPELLPDSLASRILDLEYQSQTEALNKQLIANISMLYIDAIQYYQSRNNEKYKIYHKRMELFLKKPAIDQILKGKSGELVAKKQNTEKDIIQARNKSKSQVHRIINQTDKRAQTQKQIVNKQIRQQNKKLQQRIHKRKTMSNRSVYSERDDLDNQEGVSPTKMVNLGLMLGPMHSGRDRGAKKVFI